MSRPLRAFYWLHVPLIFVGTVAVGAEYGFLVALVDWPALGGFLFPTILAVLGLIAISALMFLIPPIPPQLSPRVFDALNLATMLLWHVGSGVGLYLHSGDDARSFGHVVIASMIAWGLLSSAAMVGLWLWLRRDDARDRARWTGYASVGLARLATLIGGPKRAWRGEEYLGGLTGEGAPTGWRQIRHAAGLVVAAIVMRARDAGAVLMRPVDWLLAKPRTEYAAGIAAAGTAAYFLQLGGLPSLLGNLDNVLAAAAVVEGGGFFLRLQRGVAPVAPKARRDRP